MKVGLGLYREMLTDANFRFAAQAGATQIVAHLTNYFAGTSPTLGRGEEGTGWGDCRADTLWTYAEMAELVERASRFGLTIAALELLAEILVRHPARRPQEARAGGRVEADRP